MNTQGDIGKEDRKKKKAKSYDGRKENKKERNTVTHPHIYS